MQPANNIQPSACLRLIFKTCTSTQYVFSFTPQIGALHNLWTWAVSWETGLIWVDGFMNQFTCWLNARNVSEASTAKSRNRRQHRMRVRKGARGRWTSALRVGRSTAFMLNPSMTRKGHRTHLKRCVGESNTFVWLRRFRRKLNWPNQSTSSQSIQT